MNGVLPESFKPVFETDYQIVNYDAGRRVLWQKYLSSTEAMTPEDYEKQIELGGRALMSHDCGTLVSDMSDFLFTIPPEMQQGVNSGIKALLLAQGVERFLIVGSQDWIVELSIEQTMEEGDGQFRPYQLAVCESPEEALKKL